MIQNFTNEEWKYIPDFESEYMISNYGRVKSCDRYLKDKIGRIRFFPEHLKKLNINPNGYLMCCISRHHKNTNIYPHILVCTLFNENKPSQNHVVNHKDTNKLNNYYKNLEWITYSQNNIPYYKNKHSIKKKSSGIAEPIIIVFKNNDIKEYFSMKEVKRSLSISESHAWRIVDSDKYYNNSFKLYRKSTYEKL